MAYWKQSDMARYKYRPRALAVEVITILLIPEHAIIIRYAFS